MACSSFNQLLGEFSSELTQAFPADQTVQLFHAMLPEIIDKTPSKPMEIFTNVYGPYSDYIQNSDSRLFDEVPELLGVPIAALYKNATPTTQASLFAYLQNLSMLATASSIIPADVMEKITSMAQGLSERINDGENIDLMSIMSEMPGLMSSMLATSDGGQNLLQFP